MLGRRSFLFLVSKLFASALSYIGLLLLLNFFGKDVYGNLSFALALVATFSAFSDLGFSSAHIKRISEGKDVNDCVSTFTAIKLALTGLSVVISLASILIWTVFLGGNLSGVTMSLVLLFVLYTALYNLSSIATTTYAATMEQAKAQIISLFDPLVRIPLIAIVAFGSHGAVEAAYAYVLGSLAIMLLSLLFLRRDRIKWRRPTLYRSYWVFAMPLVLISVVSAVAGNMDKLALGFFWNYDSVASYTACMTFLGVIGIIGAAVSTMTFPAFSKMHSENRLSEIRTATAHAERYLSMVTMPVLAFIVVFPSETARILLSAGLESAGEAMRLLAIATLLNLLNTVHLSQILAVDRSDLSAKIILLNFVIFGIFLLIMVPEQLFGIPLLGLDFYGAALANISAAAIIFVVIRIVVWNLTKTGSNLKVLLHLLAGMIAGMAIFLFSEVRPIGTLIDLVLYSLALLVLFVAVLAAMKEFRKADLDYLLDIIDLRKLWTYMSDEVRSK